MKNFNRNPSPTEKKVLESIGTKLKSLRLKKNFSTKSNFAIHANINRVVYQRIERGSSNLNILTLHNILKHLDSSIPQFFKHEPSL